MTLAALVQRQHAGLSRQRSGFESPGRRLGSSPCPWLAAFSQRYTKAQGGQGRIDRAVWQGRSLWCREHLRENLQYEAGWDNQEYSSRPITYRSRFKSWSRYCAAGARKQVPVILCEQEDAQEPSLAVRRVRHGRRVRVHTLQHPSPRAKSTDRPCSGPLTRRTRVQISVGPLDQCTLSCRYRPGMGRARWGSTPRGPQRAGSLASHKALGF